MTAPTTFTLLPPEIAGQTVTFAWTVDPASDLYHEEHCSLVFPEEIDPGVIPESLLWMTEMLLLVSHWALLAPCVVRIPIRLAPGEAETWERLTRSFAITLWALRGSSPPDEGVRIVDGSRSLPRPSPEGDRTASAFSGGKDSMVQASLLREIGADPVLVSVTSPMADRDDHGTVHRRRAFEEFPARRGATLFEVVSDFRAAWDNDAAARRGFPLAVNEITDTFLYTAALVLVGHVTGASHLFLASESEVSRVAQGEAGLLQHRHFMYSAVTLGVLSRLLEPFGTRLSSITVPLHSNQVQRLLTGRYSDVADLQFSCWRATDERRACSECSECRRLTWVVLAAGGRPADLGVDLTTILSGPGDLIPPVRSHAHSPDAMVNEEFAEQSRAALGAVPMRRVVRDIVGRHPTYLLRPRGWAGLRRFVTERAACRLSGPPDPIGYLRSHLQFIDLMARDGASLVFDAEFETSNAADEASAIATEVARITAPLDREPVQTSTRLEP